MIILRFLRNGSASHFVPTTSAGDFLFHGSHVPHKAGKRASLIRRVP
jgi:hypothetical protein